MTIRWQIALGFGVFILVVALLLWGLQIVLLGPFYRGVKTAQVRAAAETVERALDAEDLDERVRSLADDLGLAVVVTDELGTQYSGWKANRRESLIELMDRRSLRTVFEEVNLQGGSRLETYTAPYAYSDGEKAQLLLYIRIARTPAGNNRMILIESEITPVDAVVDTLRVQLLCVTAVMVALGSLLAFFIARRISRPVAALSSAAKGLAGGGGVPADPSNTRFFGGGSREVNELAATLNYAAQEISKTEGLRRELLANVSHDLRTPLTMIRGYAEVMRDLPGENTPENVQIIIDEAQRLTDLVNDLLDLSKLEAGAVTLSPTRFDLTQSIREILERFHKLNDYRFTFSAGEDVFVYADALKISQVVYNLVNNAVNYAGEDKTVALSQQVRGDRVRVLVSDTGEGIPPDKLKDIWERYYKVDREHRRSQAGTGLGLSIVKNILTLHGGAYGVESVLGRGSTFWFELPLAPEEKTGYNRARSESAPPAAP